MAEEKMKGNRKVSRLVDQSLKLTVTAFFALWLFVPGVFGWLEGEISTADVTFESFIFAKDRVVGPIAVMISLARVLIALSVPAALYRNDVSEMLGLDLYGPRTLGRLLFIIGAILYVAGGFVAWKTLTGGF